MWRSKAGRWCKCRCRTGKTNLGWCCYRSITDRIHLGWCGYRSTTGKTNLGWCGYRSTTDRIHLGWCGYNSTTGKTHLGWCGYRSTTGRIHPQKSCYISVIRSINQRFHMSSNSLLTGRNLRQNWALNGRSSASTGWGWEGEREEGKWREGCNCIYLEQPQIIPWL